MFLKLDDAGVPMKLVYQLTEELRQNPARVKRTQELTLDKSRPAMGLKGTYGLYASETWWESIRNGTMPLRCFSGVICDAYAAGQDASDVNNTIDVSWSDGSRRAMGIYTNTESDIDLFRKGHRVDVVYALDDLKDEANPYDGNRYLRIVLELAVSTKPVASGAQHEK
jgi:hypothetical protein